MRTNKTCESSNPVKELEGELYEVIHCQGSKKGYGCTCKVTQPMQLTSIIKLHKVNYRGWEISGPTEDWEFIRMPDSELLEMALCTDKDTPHPACTLVEIQDKCKRALDSNNIQDTIHNCNFTLNTNPNIFEMMDEGGIFVQRAKSISSGTSSIPNPAPIIIYSPDKVTLTQEGEEFIIVPNKKVDTLSIIDSALTNEDIEYIQTFHDGDDWIDNLDGEDYINIGLGAAQLILLPITIYGLVCTFRQRKLLYSLTETVHGPSRKSIYKKNLIKIGKK
jgi:hypothetical protein